MKSVANALHWQHGTQGPQWTTRQGYASTKLYLGAGEMAQWLRSLILCGGPRFSFQLCYNSSQLPVWLWCSRIRCPLLDSESITCTWCTLPKLTHLTGVFKSKNQNQSKNPLHFLRQAHCQIQPVCWGCWFIPTAQTQNNHTETILFAILFGQ